jgi:hypothetical protein
MASLSTACGLRRGAPAVQEDCHRWRVAGVCSHGPEVGDRVALDPLVLLLLDLPARTAVGEAKVEDDLADLGGIGARCA